MKGKPDKKKKKGFLVNQNNVGSIFKKIKKTVVNFKKDLTIR